MKNLLFFDVISKTLACRKSLSV